MSKLHQFREIERRIAEQMKLLERLQNDEEVQRALVFEEELKKLMEKYMQTPDSVMRILYPSSLSAMAPPTRRRKLKIYVHPQTGERIETKGSNHKRLKEWKEEHGNDVVEAWLI